MTDDTNMVTVTCPNHHQKLTNWLWNLLQTKSGLDSELKCGERSVGVHGVVLLAFLPTDSTTERSTDIREDSEVVKQEPLPSDDLLLSVLEFLYKGTVTLSRGQLDDLQATARQLDFRLLVDAVEETKRREPVELIILSEDEVSSEMSSEIPSLSGSRETDARRERATEELNLMRPAGEHLARSGRLARLPCHPAIEHDPSALIFRCSKCRDKFLTEAAMQHHCDLKTCSGQPHAESEQSKALGFKCEFCDKKYRVEMNLVKHMTDHPMYRCSMCCFESRYSWSLIRHQETIHRVDAKGNFVTAVKCPECEFYTLSNNRLLRHRKLRHPLSKLQKQKKTITCRFCRKSFYSAESHDAHVIGHPTYSCSACDYQSKYRRNLCAHRKRAHPVDEKGDPVSALKSVRQVPPAPRAMPYAFKCVFCTRLFRSEETCAEHMASHPKYKCTMCSFESHYNWSFNSHLMIVHHVGSKEHSRSNFKCPDCSYSTWNNDTLKVHRRRRHDFLELAEPQVDQHVSPEHPDERPTESAGPTLPVAGADTD